MTTMGEPLTAGAEPQPVTTPTRKRRGLRYWAISFGAFVALLAVIAVVDNVTTGPAAPPTLG